MNGKKSEHIRIKFLSILFNRSQKCLYLLIRSTKAFRDFLENELLILEQTSSRRIKYWLVKLSLPVASDGVNGAIVTTKGNIESNDSVASLDEVQILLRNISLGGCAVKEELDLLEESWFLELVELWAEVCGINACSLGEESRLYK